MIASGGLDFDDIPRCNTAEEENYRGKLSNRSESSNWSIDSDSTSTEMTTGYSFNMDKHNPLVARQKRMVMNEIKRKVFSSDSEKDNDMINEYDDIYGRTPPRQIRRAKQKFKCNFKFNNGVQLNLRNSERKHKDRKSCPPSLTSGNFQFNWQNEIEEGTRKEKVVVSKNQSKANEFATRSTKLVRVNSTKSLKSIAQQKTINYHSKNEEFSGHKFMLNAYMFQKSYQPKKSSRQHFYKTFSLLVNLGGRTTPYHFDNTEPHHEESDDWQQVEYPQLIWLEMQKWRSGRQTIEDQDNYLQEERLKINDILDEVINFKFTYKSTDFCPVQGHTCKTSSENILNNSDEYITFGAKQEDQLSSIEDNMNESKQAPTDDFEKFHIDKEKNMESLELSKIRKVAAMQDVMKLLDKVSQVESLYPSRKALSKEHPKFNDVKFTRNMEAMLLWLNINKELHHKLYTLAEWIDIDVNDLATWKDWFDHGLDLLCLKTKQSYQFSHKITTADHLESSSNLGSLLTNFELRRSKREKRNRISQNRLSLIEKTATSRYRLFVEQGIRDHAMVGLMKKVRYILQFVLIKTKYCLVEKPEIDLFIDREKDLRKVYEHLMKNSSVEVPSFDNDAEEHNYIQCKYMKFSEYKKHFHEMCLPSFADTYWFLAMTPIDISHECLRFRLEYKPKVEPSHHSIRQLINECKEVMSCSVLCHWTMKDLVLEISEEKASYVSRRFEEFSDDLKTMLNMYFDYLHNWFEMMRNSIRASDNLRTIIEEEWSFAKDICPFIKGGDARAGHKFCVLVSSLIKSTEQCLETAVDECYSCNNPSEDDEGQRQKMLSACRQYKEIFRDVRERATTALGFAKMLQKDLGIASKYKMNGSFEEVFKALRESKHYKVEYHGVNLGFDIFVSEKCPRSEQFCTQLINLTFGYESSEFNDDGYVVLLPKQSTEKPCLWRGRCFSAEVTSEARLALSYVEEVKYMTLICKNSYHLNTKRKRFEQTLGDLVTVTSEHTSSHNVIAKALHELKMTTKTFAQVLVKAVEHVNDNLDLKTTSEMDEADRNSTHKICIETMHSCFSVGFEYLREVVRMNHGSNHGIRDYFLKFSKMWMKFVTTKTERGRGTKPRWAVSGMEFLVATSDPQYTEMMSDDDFHNLKKEMHDCVEHIIGKAEPKHKRKAKGEKRSSSPFTVHRSRSVPSKPDMMNNQSGSTKSTSSLPVEFKTKTLTSNSLSDLEESHLPHTTVSDADTTSESIQEEFDDEEDGGVSDEGNDSPMIMVLTQLKGIDERRTAKLQRLRVIGSVTYKKANFASELVHNVRKVNFKWQLGNKIGEGQFGKVYSAVNLDTGDLMAVKQIRFNPHDYGTIQEIADEITNIQGIKHDSLVKYFGVELHKDEMLIFMEYCADGTIAEVSKLGLPESMIRVYTLQILKAISFLHQNGVIHRDIKGANIFLSSSGLIKIGDFGSAVKLKDPMCTSHGEVFNTRGTAAFMAPEVITLDKGRGYGRAADVWSLGCVVIEMTTGRQPWYDCDNIYAIMYRVGDGNHPPIPDCLSEEGQDFLMCCFVHDHNNRWTAHMLEDHPFVKCC